MLSMSTNYATSTGCPEPYLRRIAEAGFSHVHWCHQWCTDFLYSQSEIDQISAWLEDLGLEVLDLHASHGNEKGWVSPREYERLAGVELVQNRISMALRLSADAIVLHATEPEEASANALFWDQLHRSLDALEPFARRHKVRIALENLGDDNFPAIQRLFSEYGAEFLGLCYDSGHGNMIGDGLDRLDLLKDRLIAVHLHDNDGGSDQHKLPFSGTVDWKRLARIVAESAYNRCVSLEVGYGRSGLKDEQVFLEKAFDTATRFSEMLSRERTLREQATVAGKRCRSGEVL